MILSRLGRPNKRIVKETVIGALGYLLSNTTRRQISIPGQSQSNGRGVRDAVGRPDDALDGAWVLHPVAEGAVLAGRKTSAGNYQGRCFLANTRLRGLQRERPFDGSLFCGDATQPNGYPGRLAQSAATDSVNRRMTSFNAAAADHCRSRANRGFAHRVFTRFAV